MQKMASYPVPQLPSDLLTCRIQSKGQHIMLHRRVNFLALGFGQESLRQPADVVVAELHRNAIGFDPDLYPGGDLKAFRRKGALFRGKRGLAPPLPKFPVDPPAPFFSWKTPPPPGIFSKTPHRALLGERGEGPGGQAPFAAKKSPLFGENAFFREQKRHIRKFFFFSF